MAFAEAFSGHGNGLPCSVRPGKARLPSGKSLQTDVRI